MLCWLGFEEPGQTSIEEVPAAEEDLSIGGVRYERLDQQANEHTSSSQEAATLARLDNGDHVVAWHSRRQQASGTYGVYARLYAGDGTPRTGEVQVNANIHGDQIRPSIDVADDGSIWFAWESFGHDGEAGAIVARRFTSDLASATPEELVNTKAAGHQNGAAIACDADGALVAWTTVDPVSGARDICLRRMSAVGEAGAEVQLDAPADARDGCVNLARAGDGFLVVWARTDPDGVPRGIHGRFVDGVGVPLGDAFAISAAGQAIEPATTSCDSTFAVAWLVAEGADYVARVRRFERQSDGELELGVARTLETGTGGWLSGLDVDLNAAGEMLVAWSRYAEEKFRSGTFARIYGAADETIADTFEVTGHTDGHQSLWAASSARHIVLGDGLEIAVAWNGDADQGDGSAAAWTIAAPAGQLELLATAEPMAAEPRGEFADPSLGARPHEPPIRSSGPIDRTKLHLPESGSGFFGIDQTTLTPPDPEIAVGPTHIVAVVNDGIAFFDKAGNQTFLDCVGCLNTGFFGNLVNSIDDLVFDPEAIYDSHSGRFFVMYSMRAADGTSDFLVGVSDDSNPNGNWHLYDFDVTAAAGDDIDSPQLAADATHVYLTADFFLPDEHLIFVAEKAPMLSGNSPLTASHLIVGDHSFGLPNTYDANAPAQYMIESTEFGNNTNVRFWAITNPANPGNNLQTFTLNVPAYQFPELPPQQGTSIRPFVFEPRFWSCAYIGGSLWATHHVNSTRVRQRWYEFDMRGWPTSGNTPVMVQNGEIDPGGTTRTFFGSIAADADGNAMMNVSRSSPTEFISMWTTHRLAGDALGTTAPLTLAQASTAPDRSLRWGDYSGAKPDPSQAGLFWGHGELQVGAWTTYIKPVQLDVGGPTVYCTAKTSSSGCVTQIGTSLSGNPITGANDYSVTASSVQGIKNGILFGGNGGPAAIPFSGGTLCVNPPTRRSPLQGSGGSTPISCDGSYSLVVNDGLTFPAGLDAGAGNSGWYQYWCHDPMNGAGTLGTALSNAVQLDFQ